MHLTLLAGNKSSRGDIDDRIHRGDRVLKLLLAV